MRRVAALAAVVAALALGADAAGTSAVRGGRYYAWRSELGEDGRPAPAKPLPAWLKKRTESPLVAAGEAPSVRYSLGAGRYDDEAAKVIRADERYLAGEDSEEESPAAEAERAEKEHSKEEESGDARTKGELEAKKELLSLAAMDHFAHDRNRFVLERRSRHLPPNLQHLANGLPQGGGLTRAPDGPGTYVNSLHNLGAVARGYELAARGAFLPGAFGIDVGPYTDIFDADGEDEGSGVADPDDPAKAEPTEEA